ncbi:MAG: DNA polymerase III subunit gamma/tau [Ruminococcus sp.]|nr:DNA polymerase III subunit gamma/tau [Ruminococcus sp.]
MYCALYRKWRPLSFDDVVSQSHITTTLKNQIIAGKTAHAYLFTGSRGTGKTTCARIFAKTINCPNMHDGEPCLECDICKSAENQSLTDIVEIDAASNTGVDDVRQLKESALYLPEQTKYKVYIIDEVHMLSNNAFNALLKLLEEPPEHIKFILATTEVHKIPPTILSRCQRFDFSRIKPEDIKNRLLYIASKEGFVLHEDAAELIAKLSDGGMRDALSMTDQCTAYSDEVTIDTVTTAVGISGREYVFDILLAIMSNDTAKAINGINELYSMSKDMQKLCEELISQTRNAMIIKTVGKASDLIACTPEEYKQLEEIANANSLDKIIEKLEGLEELNEHLLRATNKRIQFEMGLVKICGNKSVNTPTGQTSGSASVDIAPLLSRISKLEEQLKNAGSVGAQAPQPEKQYDPIIPTNQQTPEKPKVDLSKVRPEDFEPLVNWAEILNRLVEKSPATSAFMNDSSAYVYQNIILIVVKNKLLIKMLKDHVKYLDEAIYETLGSRYAIRVRAVSNDEQNDKESPINKLLDKAKKLNIDTEVI